MERITIDSTREGYMSRNKWQSLQLNFEWLINYQGESTLWPKNLKTPMEWFIIYAQGMHPKVVIYPMVRQESLRSMGVIATTSLVGDVLEKREPKAEWV